MSEILPAPLVAPEVDLRGFEFMPLYCERLFKSKTWIAASPEAKIAALRLWWQAYGHECPAGSLPDDDALLAEYAGYGVAIRTWKRLKEQAMRGWILCSDGRLYHPFVADRVKEAWAMRQAHTRRTLKGRITQLENRLKDAKTQDDRDHLNELLHDLRQQLLQAPEKSVTDSQPPLSHAGQDRTGTGQDSKNKSARADGDSKPESKTDPMEQATLRGIMAKELREAGVNVTPSHPLLVAWIGKGVTIQIAREAVDLARDKKPKPQPIPPAYLDPIIAELMNPESQQSKVEKAALRDWWTTGQGIEAKAKEHGIVMVQDQDRPLGEYHDRLRCAVAAQIGIGPWINERNATDMRLYDLYLKKGNQ